MANHQYARRRAVRVCLGNDAVERRGESRTAADSVCGIPPAPERQECVPIGPHQILATPRDVDANDGYLWRPLRGGCSRAVSQLQQSVLEFLGVLRLASRWRLCCVVLPAMHVDDGDDLASRRLRLGAVE